MSNTTVIRLMKLIKPLSFEMKLEILSELTKSLKTKLNNKDNEKEKMLDQLFGSWNDTNDKLIKDIYDSRISSNKKISFD